ncbi:hypothetical protein P7D22_14675 [Lichenihabitans sp. Uapishka_5]|uniref:hypothetical protein n=1 Tax=Lichenihabitans sp. Uapishka_5 TaxID=3037302 RepID=UPI0029E7D6C0|nr:hypothetical protein [Lichenihabitans sp. Uapishka_5]MDX7952413.1 hypothetical protein [Lichenihabitans sp. Uapishka_5]
MESFRAGGDRFAWAEIHFEAARVDALDAPRRHAMALALYEAEVRPQRFHVQRRAELLIEMRRFTEAEALLTARTDLDRNEWLQRLMARVRLETGDPLNALAWIDRASSSLKAEHFRSEFLELRSEIRAALGDPLAIEDLVKARKASQKAGEAGRLEARLTRVASPE